MAGARSAAAGRSLGSLAFRSWDQAPHQCDLLCRTTISRQSWKSLVFLGLWLYNSNLCFHLHIITLPLCVCVQISLFLSGH
ncbi:unnamed protein product [Nyctereutes procyonoides]|uniref:(raccoon dog) hypothetical protein n=1 Tax=Nyctereutes procyonoides TaxID=34880 RepID=A0A811Y2Q5_NYCPR|nr:unnamed protein product [Nyctereutes procyonoides]